MAKWVIRFSWLVLPCGFSACTSLQDSAATNPYQYAPSRPGKPWPVTGMPLAPGQGRDPGTTGAVHPTHRLTGNLPADGGIAAAVARTNDLADLIDLAQRNNPATRVAWEQARTAAARLGIADSAYAPVLALLATGGYTHEDYPAPGGILEAEGPSINPSVSLQWSLIDFGRRRAAFEGAAQQLLQANLQFNRAHQRLAFDVQRTFYAFDTSRAEQAAAEASLETARSVERAAEVRLERGLGTETDLLQARQELARANFDLQTARRRVSDSWALLAEAVGISPSLVLPMGDLSSQALPTHLVASVESAMDRAMRQRPDLAAQVAEVRAREAEVRRSEAEFRPRIGLSGTAGGNLGRWYVTAPGNPSSSYSYTEAEYAAYLTFSWNVFDGFERNNRVREAKSRRDEAESRLVALELQAQREVWQAYANARASFVQYDFARALLTASENGYESALRAYDNGLGTVVQLLTAERDLAQARMILVRGRADVLTSSAALAFAIGEPRQETGSRDEVSRRTGR
ncbi:MAG: TolC family protein [Verrucomicrobiae bacterium]|nr:TolC family protein [Verrucomicrobiae bacterium]